MVGVCPLICRNKGLLAFLCSFIILVNVVYLKLPSMVLVFSNTELITKVHTSLIPTSQPLDNKRSWQTDRQDILTKGKPIKLFLFSYMRGGSSIAGELFNCDPSATMWYEPGDAFFSAYYGLYHENLPQDDLYFKNMTRRKLDADELDTMLNFYNDTFSCNYKGLPPEAMAHYFLSESTAMDGFVLCMRGKRTKNVNINACNKHTRGICGTKTVEASRRAKCHTTIAAVRAIMKSNPGAKNDSAVISLLLDKLKGLANWSSTEPTRLLQFVRHERCIATMQQDNGKCIAGAETKCRNDTLRVVQVNRMKMEDLEPIIEANPDIYVVHYTRDPRAIALSRQKTGVLTFDKTNRNSVNEAKFVCTKMREDLRVRIALEKKYPGVFSHLTYESLAVHPEETAQAFYTIFNRRRPKQWTRFIALHMHGQSESAGFGITVKNATKTAFGWKTNIPKSQLEYINSFCADVITGLNYSL